MEENKISENIVEKIGITKEWTYIGSAPCNIKPQGSTDSFRFLPIFRGILGVDWDLRTRRIPRKKNFISKVSSGVVREIFYEDS